MKTSLKVFLFIVVLAALCGIVSCSDEQHRRELTAWASLRGETIQKIERRTFNIGPYWYIKGASYYKVTTDRGIYWVQYIFGRSIKQETGNWKYRDIEQEYGNWKYRDIE